MPDNPNYPGKPETPAPAPEIMAEQLPDLAEYIRLKYRVEMDGDLVVMLQDLIVREQAKHRGKDNR